MRAPFITFEGGDGAGKSTQVKRLAQSLEHMGLAVRLTREPGGAPGAEKLRTLLVTGATDAFTPMAEALMMYAARAEHLSHTINPARADGQIVISDRFSDSTMAYQGHAGGLTPELVAQLDKIVVGEDAPDLTVILDLQPDEGLARARSRSSDAPMRASPDVSAEDRFEKKGAQFQSRVRDGFLAIAQNDPDRCHVINAGGSVDDIAGAVLDAVRPLIEQWRSVNG